MVAVAVVMQITAQTRTIRTCIFCRAERTDRTLFGYSWQSFRNNEFTEWYRMNGPAHQHVWGRLSCTQGGSIFGTMTYFTCSPRHPVCDISPANLKEFAEHADAATLAAYFDGIASTDPDLQRHAVQMVWGQMRETR